MRTPHIPDVGVPDPELGTSPILDEREEFDDGLVDAEGVGGVCYFNDRQFAVGQYVQSGSELLHCEGRGIWVRSGELRPSPG